MDYGDRQERAELLVRTFRTKGSQPVGVPIRGKFWTGDEVAHEIEAMSEFGREVVAVAGLVLRALATTPEFFERRRQAAAQN